MSGIVRPCFIVIDPEHSGSISTRKLVIETAKLNVITAYSAAEAVETLKKFPAADGIVCTTQVRDIPLPKMLRTVRQIHPKIPVVVIGPSADELGEADYHVDSFDPRRLLDVLRGLTPEKANAIQQHEDELGKDEERQAKKEED